MRTLPLLTPLDDPGLPRCQPRSLCLHTPACPTGTSTDADRARVVAAYPEQGWSLLCNGVLVFDDTGELLPDGRAVDPHRPAVAADYWVRWRHPHVAGSDPGPWDTLTVHVRPFTGLEDQPHLPADAWSDPAVTREQRRRLSTEYDAAQVAWSEARLRRQAAPLLREAAPLWQAWTIARDTLTRVFDGFREATDGHWQAQLLHLADAEAVAEAAADRFDAVAADLARLAHEQIRAAGEDHDLPLHTVAQEIGLDASDWQIAWHASYNGGAPATYGDRLSDYLHQQITTQRTRLRELDALTEGLRRHSTLPVPH